MSAVRQYETMPDQPLHPRSKPKIRTRPKSRPKLRRIRRDIEYIRYDTRRYRIPIPIIFTVFLIFAGGVGTAFSFAYLQDMRQNITRERAAILQQQSENDATRAEIAQRMSVEDVSRIARERLNMDLPDASQIVRINVPRQSYVMQSYAERPTRPEGMWQSAWWYIRNWLS